MTRIRLARTGSVHQPHYRIVVADSHARRDGKFIEILGSYHPLEKGAVTINQDRAAYWLSVGAQPSTTLIHILTKGGVKHDFTVRRKPTKAAKNPVEPKAAPAVVAAPATDEAVTENPVSDAAAEAQSETAEPSVESVVETPAAESETAAPTEEVTE